MALAPVASADTYPYLVLNGGDTWTGGAFESGGGCSNTSSAPFYYQSTSTGGGGGVATYAGSSGTSEDFGLFALGPIASASGSGGVPNQGTYSDKTGAGGHNLTFANTNGSNPDGSFGGTHCVPDYYGTKQNSPAAWTGNYSASGQFKATGPLTLSGGTIPAGTHLTLFVQGDVYITGNIFEASYNESNVPKFALVVKGNIFVDPNVGEIDGWYIAQPDTSSTINYNKTGYIFTCDDSARSLSPLGTEIHDRCAGNQFTVNGALTAKQVNYLRTSGDVNGNGAPNAPAETLNYTAADVLGGPFFNPPASNKLDVQSLISLPPLF